MTEPDARGGRDNGIRRPWATLTPAERRRLVAPDGGSCLLAVKNGGGPFTAWATVFERTSDRLRARFEPRFPHVNPHRLRHSFSMRTLKYLVTGHYRQAARMVADTDADAALVFYLSKADPLLVLRDLLGHSTVLTTEKYLRRLDTTRIYRQAYEGAGAAAGLAGDTGAEREAADEFNGDPLPSSRTTLNYAAGIIRRHRNSIGSRWRKLNPGQQALLVLAYLRKGETFAELAAGFAVGTTTAWRYVKEVLALLAARAPKLRQAVRDAKKAGYAYVVLDGTLIPIDRVAADRPFYSGKHKRHGMNLQVIASPGGDVLWVSGALPGSVHDKKAEWIWDVLAELEAAGLVTLADKGYQGSSYAKIPYRGKNKPESQKQANRAHAKLRAPGERANASSRPGESSASSAAAPGAPASSPRPFTYCRSAKHKQDGKGSVYWLFCCQVQSDRCQSAA